MFKRLIRLSLLRSLFSDPNLCVSDQLPFVRISNTTQNFLSFLFRLAMNKCTCEIFIWQSCDDDITRKSRFWAEAGLNVSNRCNFVRILRISFSWNIIIQCSRIEIQSFREHFHPGQMIAHVMKNTRNKTHQFFFPLLVSWSPRGILKISLIITKLHVFRRTSNGGSVI